MRNFFRRNRNKTASALLLGRWRIIRIEGNLDVGSNVTMQFERDSRLTYAIQEADKTQMIRLVYRVEGDTIISNQPSAPREERTHFALTPDGQLVLDYNGNKAFLRREGCGEQGA